MRRRNKLTDLQVRAWLREQQPRAICDGDNLWLTPKSSGDPVWVVRYRIHGRRREITLGAYSVLPLAEARHQAATIRSQVFYGQDPSEKRKADKLRLRAALTYRQLFEDYIVVRGPELAPITLTELRRMHDKDVLPRLGATAVGEIQPAHLVAVIRIIGARSQSVARRVWEQVCVVLQHAVSISQLQRNPANELSISSILGKKPPRKKRVKLSVEHLGMVVLRAREQGPVNEATTKILLYACVRKSELLTARWEQLDLQAGLWHIPAEAEGNKSRRAYSIPLAPQAVSWFEELKVIAGESPYVLPRQVQRRSSKSRTMSRSTLNLVFRRISGDDLPKFSPQDLRSTARSYLGEFEPNQLIVERCLNHSLGGLIEVYDRSDFLVERRALLEKWAGLIARVQSG